MRQRLVSRNVRARYQNAHYGDDGGSWATLMHTVDGANTGMLMWEPRRRLRRRVCSQRLWVQGCARPQRWLKECSRR